MGGSAADDVSSGTGGGGAAAAAAVGVDSGDVDCMMCSDEEEEAEGRGKGVVAAAMVDRGPAGGRPAVSLRAQQRVRLYLDSGDGPGDNTMETRHVMRIFPFPFP